MAPLQLHSSYFRGEANINGFDVDGYASDGKRHYIFEYLGCQIHVSNFYMIHIIIHILKGHDHVEIDDKTDRRLKWENRYKQLSKIGQVEFIWECHWMEEIHKHMKINTEIGRSLFAADTEEKLLEGIADGSLFGFAVCSVKCPKSLYDQYQADGFLFPPIVQKMTVTMDMLSPYMREQYELEGSNCEEPTLVQTYNGTDLLLFTPLIRFYMTKGFQVYDCKQFMQYIPAKVFSPFVKKGNKKYLKK